MIKETNIQGIGSNRDTIKKEDIFNRKSSSVNAKSILEYFSHAKSWDDFNDKQEYHIENNISSHFRELGDNEISETLVNMLEKENLDYYAIKRLSDFLKITLNNKFFTAQHDLDWASLIKSGKSSADASEGEKYETNGRELMKAIENIENILNTALNNEKISYFLKLRIKDLLSGLVKWKLPKKEIVPFLICKNTFAFPVGNDYLIIDNVDEQEVIELINERNSAKKKADNTYQSMGNYVAENSDSARKYLRDLYDKFEIKEDVIKKYFENAISLRELIKQRKEIMAFGSEQQRGVDEDFYDFLFIGEDENRKIIENEFGIKLSDIPLLQQLQFMNFLKEKNSSQLNPVKHIANTFGNNAVKAFLSIEYDRTAGDMVLNISEKLEAKDAEIVFKKIAEISDLATKESRELQSMFFKDNSEREIPNIQTELLRKSHEIIKKFSNELSDEQVDHEKINTLLNDLEKSKTEIIFLASAMRSFKGRGEKIDLETVRELDFSVKDFGQEFSDEEKEEMLSIAEINWRQNPNMKDMVVESFEKSLGDAKNQKFYVLKYQGKIVSFVRFEKTDRGTLYAGSFNVYSDARSTGIGEEMMNRALKKESEDNILEATVSPRIPAGTAYVERVGFVINGMIANYHETGEPLFNIELDNEKNKTYQYRNEGKEIQIDEEEIKKQVCSQEMLEHMIGNQEIILAFDMKNDFEKINETMQKLLLAKDDDGRNVGDEIENKYIITRYFRDKTETEKDVRYFVFEKIKN